MRPAELEAAPAAVDTTDVGQPEADQPEEPKAALWPSRKTILTACFAVAAGWADLVCFKEFGSFAALMTGNTVKLAISLVDDNGYPPVYYLCILGSYIMGVIAFQLCKHVHPRRPGWAASPIILLLMCVTDLLHGPTSNNHWRVCLIAPCFGMQNSFTFGGPMAINTTIITGNMQKLGIAIWKALKEGNCRAQLKAASRPLTAWLSTFAGALAGAAVLMRASWYSNRFLFVPVGVLQALCFVTHDHIYGRPPKTPANDPNAQEVTTRAGAV